MVHTYYTTLEKAKRIASLASLAESAIFEIVGKGYVVGRTMYADELKWAADTQSAITTKVIKPAGWNNA